MAMMARDSPAPGTAATDCVVGRCGKLMEVRAWHFDCQAPTFLDWPRAWLWLAVDVRRLDLSFSVIHHEVNSEARVRFGTGKRHGMGWYGMAWDGMAWQIKNSCGEPSCLRKFGHGTFSKALPRPDLCDTHFRAPGPARASLLISSDPPVQLRDSSASTENMKGLWSARVAWQPSAAH
jgi:hypothetical protein